jgi:lipopolysaccharide/colanic/teichoic acid biosynthesis glycosyltransferase
VFISPKNHDLAEELYRRYSSGQTGGRARYLRKKYLWQFTVIGSTVLKRVIDIAGSLTALVCFLPILALSAAAVKITSPGPILFWQTRVGRWGKEFRFPKFRSMVVGAERLRDKLLMENVHQSGPTFKIKRDPRVTHVGRILRKLSIDELPQLWCVLAGDMSLVGPRPPLPAEVARYTLLDRRRLDVKPGLTCLWQVSGRSDIPFVRQVELDVQYIQSRSIWLDLIILLKTVPAILTGKGAY